MSRYNYQFPRTKYVDENGIATQSDKILSEAQEVKKASLEPDLFHHISEILDTIQACETALRIVEEKYNINVQDVTEFVLDKNRKREYYECQRTQ